MPFESDPACRPIPRPTSGDNFRLVRKLFSDPPVALDEISAHYGPICELGAGPMRVIVIGGPELIHQLFATPVESFRWAHRFNVIGLRFVIGRTSMIVSDGADHDRRRAPAQPAFARRRLNDWIPTILDRTDAAIDQLFAELPGDRATVDMYPIGRRLILGITLQAFFGDRFAAFVDEIGDLYVRPQRFIEAPAVKQLPHPVPFTLRAKVRDDRRAIDRIIDDEIAIRRRCTPVDEPDVLDAYLGSELSDAEIRDQVRSLIGAGYDTTAATFAWMVLRAAHAPDVWARLRHEADDVLGATDRQQTADHDAATLTNLVFAGRVVREALRLHPAGLIGVRAAGVDVRLGDHVVRRGALIAWSPYLAGRDPASWVEPLRFDPDRFADLTPAQKTLTDQAWLPFGRGPHSCLGFALAQMELTLIIARLAQRLDLTPRNSDLPRPLGMVVNRPEGGAHLSVTRRVEE